MQIKKIIVMSPTHYCIKRKRVYVQKSFQTRHKSASHMCVSRNLYRHHATFATLFDYIQPLNSN